MRGMTFLIFHNHGAKTNSFRILCHRAVMINRIRPTATTKTFFSNLSLPPEQHSRAGTHATQNQQQHNTRQQQQRCLETHAEHNDHRHNTNSSNNSNSTNDEEDGEDKTSAHYDYYN